MSLASNLVTKAERHERTEVGVVLTMTEDEALRIHAVLYGFDGLFTVSGVAGVYDALGEALGLAPRGLLSPYELVDWDGAPVPTLTIRKRENA